MPRRGVFSHTSTPCSSLAEQDQTRARLDYVRAIGEYDKAQYALGRALGGLGREGAPPQTQLSP